MPTCTHCKRPIGRSESFARLDAGVVLRDGTRIPRDVSLHTDCEGAWWMRHHPAIIGKVRTRVA